MRISFKSGLIVMLSIYLTVTQVPAGSNTDETGRLVHSDQNIPVLDLGQCIHLALQNNHLSQLS